MLKLKEKFVVYMQVFGHLTSVSVEESYLGREGGVELDNAG